MKFKTGTEIFRTYNYKLKTWFVKGTPFLGGQKFPLLEGIMAKDMDKVKDARQFFYMRKLNGKN